MMKDRVLTNDRRKISAVALTLALAFLPFALRRIRDKKVAEDQLAEADSDKRAQEPVEVDRVDEASMESFPASDPPAY